jgi:ubiquinone biosynthesis protein UbiJ
MLHALESLLAPAVMERLTLVANHVIGAEEVARARLLPHAGRTVEVAATGWPGLLPAPPACVFRITPAGLLEWCGPDRTGAADLTLRVDASNPAMLVARALGGEQPQVAIDGDAQLAGDVNWLLQNVRWDVEADLDRLFGPVVAAQLHRVGRLLAGAVRAALGGAGQMRDRLRPRA